LYIYDDESRFYYLKSRYYSPEARRFINVDTEVGDVGKLDGHNLFSYCNNNPIMLSDENGNWPKWLKTV
jgi:RHS repeat-associated protein